MVVHSQSQISPQQLSSTVLADSSKKLSQLSQLNELLSSDFFTVNVKRHYPKEIQFEILREELSNEIGQLIILLEDKYEKGNVETYEYLINEMKMTLQNVWYHDSYNITYGDISRHIVDRLSSEYHFGSMAYEDKWNYARSWHTHDYTYSDVKPEYQASAIAEFIISDSKTTKTLSLCLPAFEQPKYKLADIGEYRFIARTDRQQISINDPDFDGWVYADGQRYLSTDFPDAYEVFNPNHDYPTYDTFEVPLISNFVKFCAFQDSNVNSFQKVPYQNAIHQHTHEKIDDIQFANYQKSTKVNVNLNVLYGVGTTASAKALHTGYKNRSNQLTNLSVSINSNKLESLSASTNDINNDIESIPENIRIPLMVYIGKKVQS